MTEKTLMIEYTPDDDALHVSFREIEPGEVVANRELDERRIVDLAIADEVVGVEFLGVSEGIDLSGVPRAADIRQALRSLSTIRVLSAA